MEAFLRSLIPQAGAPAGPFGLERVRALLAGLGDPHRGRRVVHVAGTAGKGSTATLLASILRAAGYRTGLHVSPEVVTLGERAQVDGAPATAAELGALLDRVRPAVEALEPRPSYFETLWAMALLRFADAGTDVDVVEAGLGGGGDATNVVESRHQVLTNVGLDHTAVLGGTRAAILREKQGIVKPGSTVVSGIRDRALRAQLEGHAAALGATVAFAGRDFSARRRGGAFDLRDGDRRLRGLEVAPLGQHANGALAAATALRLGGELERIDEAAIRRGLREARLPGRLDVVRRAPLTVLDGAHNPAKVRWLVAALRDAFPGRRWITVFRFKPRADVWRSLHALDAISRHLILTRSDRPGDMGVEPGYDDAALRRAARELGASACEPPAEALARATAMAGDDPAAGVLATGSIHMLAELYAALRAD